MTQAEIDKSVSERLQNGLSVYAVDEQTVCKNSPLT